MKATALKDNVCETYWKGFQYPVLELSVYAMRIDQGHRTRVVARKDFDIKQEPGDPDELINNL